MPNLSLELCCLSTVIAILSVFTAGHAPLQRRVLPWTGGVLLGIGSFWVLPEVAEDRGWMLSLLSVSAILLLLGLIDRYVFPICPFCAVGAHCGEPSDSAHSHGTAVRLGWPLLATACMHSLFDGWTIALSSVASAPNSATALSWGVTIHKIPESMAIGFLAAQLTSSRKMALGTVALIQTAMAAGGILATFAGHIGIRLAGISTTPACALLLLFGLLAVQQEWRQHGRAPAMRAAAPGFLGCGIAALASVMLAR